MRFRRSWAFIGGLCLTTAAVATGFAGAAISGIKSALPAQTNGDVKNLLTREGAVVADLKAFQKLGKTASVAVIAAKLKADESAAALAEAAVHTDLSGKTPSAAPTNTTGVGKKLTTSNGASVQLIAFGPDPGNGILTPAAGHSLVSATVEGCAPKSGQASFNPLYFTLKMKDNTTANAALGEVDGQIDSSNQAPGSCVRGKVGFEVPSGETPTTLIFQVLGSSNPLQWRVS